MPIDLFFPLQGKAAWRQAAFFIFRIKPFSVDLVKYPYHTKIFYIMKKIWIPILFFMLAGTGVSKAQVVVVDRPVRPDVVVVRPGAAKRGHIWVEGHWRWDKKLERYVWVTAGWVRSRRGHRYVPGHWLVVTGGHKWVPGHWTRV